MILKGQTALITGANSGIGKAIAMGMAEAGANVGINYIADKDAADRITKQITEAGGHAIALEADISQEDEVENMFKNLVDQYGTIDILVSLKK